MTNSLSLNTDGINVYATLEVRAKRVGIIVLSIMISAVIAVLIAMTNYTEPEDMGSIIVPFLAVAFFGVGIPMKYLLWNLFGRETLVVSTKAISYQHDYGLFKTNLKTETFDKLGLNFEKVNDNDGVEKGKLVLVKYSAENHLPEHLYSTTVLLTVGQITQIEESILELFAIEYSEQFLGFSLN